MSSTIKINSSYKKSLIPNYVSAPPQTKVKAAHQIMAAHNDHSSASLASNDSSSSDPLESDFSEGSCEEEDIKCRVIVKKREFALDDFQILKTIGKFCCFVGTHEKLILIFTGRIINIGNNYLLHEV